MKLIDTHAHLDDDQFESELSAVLERAQTHGVSSIITVGTTVESSLIGMELSRRHAGVRAAVGIHPNHAGQAAAADWDRIRELASDRCVVAIGETGLDRFRKDTPIDLQVQFFERHLTLAVERGLPVVIHCRDAESDVLGCLERFGAGVVRGVMHSFTGSAATAARCLELGLHISFAGQLTYSNHKFDGLREVARMVPAERLLVETDSPYLAPEPHRGGRNEPAFVRLTAKRLAEIRNVPVDELVPVIWRNGMELFQIATTNAGECARDNE